MPQAAQSSAPFWLWAAPGAIVPAHDALIAAHIRNWRAEAAKSWSSFLSALFEAGPSRVARTLWHARKVLPRGCVEARRELRRLCAHIRAMFISAAIAAQSGDRAVVVRAFEIYFGGQLPEWIGVIKKLCAGEYDWPAQFTGRKRPIEVAAVELAEVDI
ncbi:MAG: hypothetical protein RML32_08345 [Gammaproteobacteria bacterium]|nr:hypothetical protein [Gammaproteobacteria bacterium]